MDTIEKIPQVKEFITSSMEMHRRKKAFAAFTTTLVVASLLLSFDLLISSPLTTIIFFMIFSAFLLVLNLMFHKVFKNQTSYKLRVSSLGLERILINSKEIFPFEKLQSVSIKRNIKGSIREIKLEFQDHDDVFINGLVNMEEFKDELLQNIIPAISLNEFKEVIDFDHPLYYIILGSILSLLTTGIFRILINLGVESLKYVQASIAVFVIATGIFMFFKKPTQGRYGKRGLISDYIMSALFILMGIYIFIIL